MKKRKPDAVQSTENNIKASMENTHSDFLTIALRQFATIIQGKFAGQINGEPEDQLRSPFEGLIEAAGAGLNIAARAIGETLLDDRLGRPDYAITVEHIPCGYVELKATGKGASVTLVKYVIP